MTFAGVKKQNRMGRSVYHAMSVSTFQNILPLKVKSPLVSFVCGLLLIINTFDVLLAFIQVL